MMTAATIDALETVFRTQGTRALIDAACETGTHINLVSDLWCAAMTATFGPVGLHKSWTNADGTPSDECLEKFPHIAFQVRDALDRIPRILASMRRDLA